MQATAFLVIGCWLTVGAGVAAGEGTAVVAQRPPWQRLLTGVDAQRATELLKRISEREAANDLPQAIEAAQELLELRQRVQGGDHWETVSVRWDLQCAQRVVALPPDERAAWLDVLRGEQQAADLEKRGLNAEAYPLRRGAWDAARRVLGDENPHTAMRCNNLGINLKAQRQYAEAQRFFERALEVCRRTLGEEHIWTAASYKALGSNLQAQKKHAQAQPLFEKALEVRRCVLGEQHLDTVKSYDELGTNLQEQGRHTQAEPLFAKALRITAGDSGSHGLPTASAHDHLRAYYHLAVNLHAQEKYAEAAPLFQKALDYQIALLGEEHVETATIYGNLGTCLGEQGKYVDAQPFLERSLGIRLRVLGAGHPATATSYNNLAMLFKDQHKYAEAQPLLEKAVEIRRRILGEEHPSTAAVYANLARNLAEQGKYVEAELVCKKVLQTCRRVLGEEHPHTADLYSAFGWVLWKRERLSQSVPVFRQVLQTRRRMLGEEHPDTAQSYSDLAANLQAQGNYAEARPLIERALEIERRLLGEGHRSTVATYTNLAANLGLAEEYEEAQALYERALDISRHVQGEEHRTTALCYANLATNLNAQGKSGEAAVLYDKALNLYGRILGGHHPDAVKLYCGYAGNLFDRGQHTQSLVLYEKASDICRRALGDDHPDTTLTYREFAFRLAALGRHAEARQQIQAAVSSYEAARLRVAERGLDRAIFGANRSPYPLLASLNARAGRSTEAWQALEANFARGLLDDALVRGGRSLTSSEAEERSRLVSQLDHVAPKILDLVTRQATDEADRKTLGALLAARAEAEQHLAVLAAAASRREIAEVEQVRAALPHDGAIVMWVDTKTDYGIHERWGCVVRCDQSPIFVSLPHGGAEGAWELSALPTLAERLAAQRIAPILPHLRGIKRLFVVPANIMAGIPVEAMTDQFTISYIPSGTQLVRLKEKSFAPVLSTLLALGDPIFSGPDRDQPMPTSLPPGGLLVTQVVPGGNAAGSGLRAGDVIVAYANVELDNPGQLSQLAAEHASDPAVTVTVWREGEERLAERQLQPGRLGVVLARQPAREAIAERRRIDHMLSATRGGNWQDLPGTRIEVSRLSRLFEPQQVTLLTDSDASEQRLAELLETGRLGQFRYLHLATHGEANAAKAFESALILAQDNLSDVDDVASGARFYDGRLTANEILESWQLNAELVTLSACESGLGRAAGGEGYLGFAQALLLAGARSVCLSLWKVDDTATALLMDRFYQNLLGKRDGLRAPLPKAEALAEAKRWLRTLTLDEATRLSAELTQGVARGAGRKTLPLLPAVPEAGLTDGALHPYAHPQYWAAFILIGDPD